MRDLLRKLPLLLLLLLASACGRSGANAPRRGPCVFDTDCPTGLRCVNSQCVEFQEPDAGVTGKLFGEPCETGGECLSGRCLGGPRGQFCTNPCGPEQECPSGFVCKVVPASGADAGTESLCALPQPLLCQPCRSDLECGGSGGDHCILSGLYGFCGQDCTYDACPEGYSCEETSRGKQCQPIGQTCDCDPGQVGRFRGCANENDLGACYGRQECRLEGWGECSARAALGETCNGVDDDCDGLVDERLSETRCTRQNAFGTCIGSNSCMGASGDRCDAPTPAAETCNYVDDDCDNAVDDGFVDARGRYVGAEYCGGCGNNCGALIKGSAVTECVLEDSGAPACRVKTCQPGFYPSADRRECLKLADSLCRSCVEDSDCAGPGSRCVELNGEKICGRDCGPGSAFPPCPGGYRCQATPVGSQCVPTSGLCECNAAQLGLTRSCTVLSCTGFQACAQSTSGPQWSACDVESFNPEICDGADNNCNGQIDERFKNAATGRYDTTAHCGFCNNDCSKYWSPTLQHTTGVCDASAATPTCRMGPCGSETAGGVTYDWVNVNGETQDGCECRRVRGNLTQDEPDERAPFTDENCDGVDGVAAHAVFVWTGAAAGGNGTITAPFRTISQGVAALSGSTARRYVLVAEGTYAENVLVGPGIRLYGGYARDFKRRDPLLYTTTVRGQASVASSALAAIHARQIPATAAQAAVNGFSIRGMDAPAAPDGQDGLASYAVLVEDCTDRLRITGNEILAGRGGKGGRGATGAQGFGRQQAPALDGASGLAQTREWGACPATTARAGGAAGTNATCVGSSGAPGGGVVCPVFNWSVTPVQGNQAAYPAGSRNGEGGYDRSFDSSSDWGCSHATESGFPSNIQTNDGRIGVAGEDGTSGPGGAGAAPLARLGSVQGNRWSASSFRAGGGGVGANAQGGGGGGAGGGTAHYPAGGCNSHEVGATGGGGGAGGCGGGGGGPGGAGGASIAVFVSFSGTPSSTQLPVLTGNRIARNLGGDGGTGGYGGVGGRGGAGGFGGSSTTWSGSTGGKGGDGGNGGVGGGGGGGAGGPSFGILAFRGSAADWSAQNVFLTQASAATGGKGGAGGSSSGAGATGGAGVDGASANVHTLMPCAAGCTAPARCDANGVCVAP